MANNKLKIIVQGGTLMTANFSTDKVEANIGEVITFTDLTDKLPTHWSWRFGDGNTAIIQNPTHSYSSMGTYSVTLLAGKDGAGDVEIKTDLISIIAAFINEYSYLFDGVDEYLNFGSIADTHFQANQPFSSSAWFKTTSTGNQDIITNWNGSSQGWRVLLVGGDLSFIFYSASSERIFVRSNNTFVDGSWHHLCFTYDGSIDASGVNLYVDGVSEAFSVVDNDLNNITISYGDFLIVGNVNFFNGNIDETAVYNKALSAAEVSDIYNAGVPIDLSTLSTAANLVFYHRADNDTWGGTNFTCIDEISANNGVSVNMEEADRVLDTP